MSAMAKWSIFSRGMQQVLGLPKECIPVIKTIQNNSLAATRCRRDVPFDAVTNPLPREDAYMIVIQIRGKNSRELWLDGRPIKTEPLCRQVALCFMICAEIPQFYFNDPLDSVNYFLPRKDSGCMIADDAEAPRIAELKFTPGVGVMDQVVQQLTRLLLPAFDTPGAGVPSSSRIISASRWVLISPRHMGA
jgi:AraC family transcriptional regulator